MSHSVALAFEDGVTRFITCDDDQTVADAAYRSRINIPLDCRDGACGTCKAVCESGEFDGGEYIDDALTADEAAQGMCLPCSMTPRSDLVVQIASTSEVAKTRAATHTTRVTAVERLSPSTARLTLAAPEGGIAFLPGQYVTIAVPGTDAGRSYSFSTPPGSDELEFLVKIIDGGVMSEYLTDRAAVGDTISFTGPHGSFFLREASRPALLIAGGTGLAPVLSMVRALRDSGSDRPVHLVYGVSTDDDLVELDTLADLASQVEGFTWDHCVSDPATAAANQGRVTTLIGPDHLHGGDVAIYLCGPPPMVEGVRAHIADLGITPTGFYYEKFLPSSPTTPAVAVPAEPVTAEPDPEPEPIAVEDAPEETAGPVDDDLVIRSIAGQRMAPAPTGSPTTPLDEDDEIVVDAPDARTIAGQTVLPDRDIAPLVVPAAPATSDGDEIAADGYEIGEEHPSVHESDAVFEARRALELGALELVIGRLSPSQVTGYRLLAEATTRHVDGDRFVDAHAYTETNAAFHDYLFTQTGNAQLLQAYQALGVKAAMAETLRRATWCDPRCAQDHLDIVDAIEAGDREAARTLIADHADRSKATMRRAMRDAVESRRPAFVSPGRFAGKVVLVTGAAQGIGEWVARRIAAEGGTLVLADRAEAVEALAEELGRDPATAENPRSVLADLETVDGAQSAVDAAIAAHGRVDVAIHVVGGTIWAKPFWEYPTEQIEKELSRSLYPTLWSCRAVIGPMIERGAGTIVNVSSVATRGIHRVPYAAAKGGVNAITSALALEAAPHGVRVVATAPGGTAAPARRIPRGPAPQSEQEKDWYQAIVDQTVDSSPMKRYGTLDEQAAAICFLASDEASYITGTVLPVAGGDLG